MKSPWSRLPFLVFYCKPISNHLSSVLRCRTNFVVLFSVFRGYDGLVDYNILFMFHHIEDLYELQTYQHVQNSVIRHARLFLEGHASDEYKTFFESLAENADIVAVFNWIFDLLAERPEAIDKFTDNPFQSVECQIYDVKGKKMAPSYVIKLRVFYRWVLMELFVVLRYNIFIKCPKTKQNLSSNVMISFQF